MKVKYKQVVQAFADCNSHGLDEDKRDLSYKSKSYFNAAELKEVMLLAVPDGYNDYNPQVVLNDVIETFRGARFKPAREGSVCIYVYAQNNNRVWLNYPHGGKLGLLADEVSLEDDGSIRLWWD